MGEFFGVFLKFFGFRWFSAMVGEDNGQIVPTPGPDNGSIIP